MVFGCRRRNDKRSLYCLRSLTSLQSSCTIYVVTKKTNDGLNEISHSSASICTTALLPALRPFLAVMTSLFDNIKLFFLGLKLPRTSLGSIWFTPDFQSHHIYHLSTVSYAFSDLSVPTFRSWHLDDERCWSMSLRRPWLHEGANYYRQRKWERGRMFDAGL